MKEIPLSQEQLTRLVHIAMGEAHANRLAIATLIASHPMPDLLLKLWNQSKPEWIDQLESANVLRAADFQDTAIRRLGAITQEIEEAELVSRP